MVVPALQGGGYDRIRTGTDATTSVPVRISFVWGFSIRGAIVTDVPRVTRESRVTLA
jgi:hypothetical protein